MASKDEVKKLAKKLANQYANLVRDAILKAAEAGHDIDVDCSAGVAHLDPDENGFRRCAPDGSETIVIKIRPRTKLGTERKQPGLLPAAAKS